MEINKTEDILNRIVGALKDDDDVEQVMAVLLAMLYGACDGMGVEGYSINMPDGRILRYEIVDENLVGDVVWQ